MAWSTKLTTLKKLKSLGNIAFSIILRNKNLIDKILKVGNSIVMLSFLYRFKVQRQSKN